MGSCTKSHPSPVKKLVHNLNSTRRGTGMPRRMACHASEHINITLGVETWFVGDQH